MQPDSTISREGGRRIRGDVRAKPPLVSIVTVVFRDKDELEEILKNLSTFDPADFELIVIDGGSKDGTVELLQQWDHKVDYWLSEPDSGIYDAMNKGAKAATGTYLLHLNAGDRLKHLPVQDLSNAYMEEIEVASFRVSLDDGLEFRPSSGLLLRFQNTLHHQGTFYRRDTFPSYNTQFKALADFDVNQRLAVRHARMKMFDHVVATHASGGMSHSPVADSEHLPIVLKNYDWIHVALAWLLSPKRGNAIGLISRLKRIAKMSRYDSQS
ncbi:MAG: glycosyltransferase [Acidobacteriaceae bacterium]